MAEVVEGALLSNDNCIAEAGVGTGKTYAYLIPAILSKKRTVVATATVGLQTQIVRKDLPFLQEQLRPHGVEFKFAIAKGKSNYVCGRAAEGLKDLGLGLSDDFHKWALDAAEGKHAGDKTDLGDQIPPEWSSVSAEECVGNACRFAKTCGYLRDKAALDGANIVVANHSMVGLDLAIWNPATPHILLGPYEALILDEAHKAVDYIRGAFSFEADRDLPERVARSLAKAKVTVESDAKDALERAVIQFFAAMPVPDPMAGFSRILPQHLTSPTVQHSILMIESATTKFLEEPRRVFNALNAAKMLGATITDSDWKMYFRCKSGIEKITRLRDAVANLAEDVSKDNTIAFTRYDNYKRIELVVTPVSIAGIMNAKLYDHVKTVVLTSATMSVEGKFDTVKEEFGISVRPEHEMRVSSPFDYDQAAVMYVTKDIPPAPKSPRDVAGLTAYSKGVAERVASLCEATDGRAFVLFTSRSELEAVANQLVPYKLNVMKQDGSTTAGALAARFKAEAAAGKKPVLLGLKSFWEGVSIEGDDLSLVIITKLPFPPQTDPIYQARCEKAGDEWFGTVALPDMIKDLQQGTGRLIRTTTDVGIVAILDDRVLTKKYGQKVLRSLPFRKMSPDIEKVKAFFRKLKGLRDGKVAA